MCKKESWKAINEKYLVSSDGRIKSVSRIVPCGQHGGTKEVKEKLCSTKQKDSGGYPTWRRIRVHRLVAQSFLEKKVGRDYVNHIDGNPSNNCVSNLEWVTHQENILHAVKIGTMRNKGERNGRATLTNIQAQEIHDKYKTGCYSLEKLGQEYGVSGTTVFNIFHGKRVWKWLKR